MIDVGKMISTIRRQRGLSQTQLAYKINTSKQAISNYERGERKPDYVTLEAIADALNVPMAMLISREEQQQALDAIYSTYEEPRARPLPTNMRPIDTMQRQRVPLIGSVAAGQPILAEEDLETYVTAPIQCDVALTVEGDSMKPNYLDGDILFIKRRPDVQEGAVAVVLIDDSAALKHVYKRPEGLTLISDNPEYAPMFVDFADHDFIQIYGVPVGFQRIFKPNPRRSIRRGVR